MKYDHLAAAIFLMSIRVMMNWDRLFSNASLVLKARPRLQLVPDHGFDLNDQNLGRRRKIPLNSL